VQFPITIGLHRSRILDALLLMVVVLDIAAILGFDCTAAVRAGLFFAIVVLATLAWRGLTPAIGTIRLERNGDISITRTGDKDFVPAVPEPGATIHPWLTVIRLSTADGCTATLIATLDSQSKADFRRLRMFMRWQANFSEPSDDA